jgi:hypothetical protein
VLTLLADGTGMDHVRSELRRIAEELEDALVE